MVCVLLGSLCFYSLVRFVFTQRSGLGTGSVVALLPPRRGVLVQLRVGSLYVAFALVSLARLQRGWCASMTSYRSAVPSQQVCIATINDTYSHL